ncbi:hypothetical protein [Arenimonas fontis]|uniref:Uncharacterized protein n=1 Tax=Arenimonas fontis TaxID=2608255 RepID=A0A5B2Z884_9GAMM|nr:hypothetical protein [Arenimonas fontis]KAA2284075.1 hypothetical protein F0415_11320 [Arenimonas fontis]
MRKVVKALVLALACGVAAPVMAEEALATDPARQQAMTRYYLAAAEAEGEPISDLMLLEMLRPDSGFIAEPTEAAQAARLQLVRRRLEARVEAASRHDPAVLAQRLGCDGQNVNTETCVRNLDHLAELAGDNAYYHLVGMSYAWMRNDAERFFRHAELAAVAPEYKPEIWRHLDAYRDRLRHAPVQMLPEHAENPALPLSDIQAMSLAAAVALPAFHYFSQPCREAEGQLRQHCLAIAMKMVGQDDSLIDLYIGESVVRALGDEAQKTWARERRRGAAWLTEAITPVLADIEGDPEAIVTYFDLLTGEGELAAMRWIAETRGLPVTPPADWVDRSERERTAGDAPKAPR